MSNPLTAPSLPRDVAERAKGALESPGKPLQIAASTATAALVVPVAWSIVSFVMAEPLSASDTSPEALGELFHALAIETMSIAAQALWFAGVALPLCYGATLVALRVVRRETPVAGDLYAAYRRGPAFLVFLSVLGLLAGVPTILWIITALVAGAVVGVLAASSSDAMASTSTITMVVVIAAIPFLVPSIYFQCRFLFAGLVIVDPHHAGEGAGAALARSWRMTRSRDTALTRITLTALGELLRGLTVGLVVGLFTRGIPAVFILLAATHDAIAPSAQAKRPPGRSA